MPISRYIVRYKKWPGQWQVRRMDPHRVWKLIKDMGRRTGIPELHPHAFRHACGVELLMRSGGNLRIVQEHLRHQDIGTTVTYTRLAQHDLQKAVAVFDAEQHGKNGTHPVPRGTEKKRG
jgi:site-specific recombinase XerD